MDNLQHMTMYAAFFLWGVAEIKAGFACPAPPGLHLLTLGIAYGVELLLLVFHLHGKSHLNVHVHTMLIVTCAMCIVGVCLEAGWPHSASAALVRPIFTLVMGTWFVHIGFILYNPLPGATPWPDHDHRAMMIITAYFAWHILAALLLTMLLARIFGTAMKSGVTVRLPDEINKVEAGYQALKSEDF